MKLGFLLPTRGLLLSEDRPQSADRIIDLACRAEEAGLDSVWVGDSLTAKPRLEPLTALAAVAARTSRVRLGTSVLLMALRHPVLLAQTLGTVDLISKGRLMIAAGVGGAFNEDQQAEWRNAGVSVRRRASRMEEMVPDNKGPGPGRNHRLQRQALRPRVRHGQALARSGGWRTHLPGMPLESAGAGCPDKARCQAR